MDFTGEVTGFLNGRKQLYFLRCHSHCLLGSWRSFSFIFSTGPEMGLLFTSRLPSTPPHPLFRHSGF